MNLRDLQYLALLAETRHFGRAAEKACVTQPTLSSQIRKLEQTLGIELFERDSRNVALTPAGQAILAEARLVLAHTDAIHDIASIYRDPLAGEFRLGIITSLSPFLAPDMLEYAAHDAPRLTIQVREDLTNTLIDLLRARELDAILIATDPEGDDLVGMDVFEEPFLIAHARENPLAKIKKLRLADIEAGKLLLLDEGHCLRDQALSICMRDTVDSRVKATSLLTLIRLAELGEGVTLIPALAARFAKGLMLRTLDAPGASRRIRLVCRRNYPRAAALDVIATAARRAAMDADVMAEKK